MEMLKITRLENNMTYAEMAKALEISRSYYEKIEIGIRKPSFKVLENLKSRFPLLDMNIFFTKQYHK